MRKLKSRGAAFVEYGLIVGLVSVVAIGAVRSTGEKTESIYCMASNGLSRVTGSEVDPSCIYGTIELAEGERFVNSPRRMEAAFSDVTFPNDKSGEHLVLSSVATKPESRYTLKTSIASLDAYDPDRTISSCYLINNDVEPICSEPGETSTLWVPADAEAIGYAITLSEDKDMPWSSDVNIAVPQSNASITIADGSWNVRVSRENPAPVVSNISVLFASPYSYERVDTGWTYGEFAAIDGKFNQPLTFEMTNLEGNTRNRKVCYKGTASSQPVCSASTASNSVARITVPAGVAQVGYEVELPAKAVGADWSVRETLVLREGALEKHRQDVTITRPNEPTQAGSLSAAFKSPYTYKQTDTGWLDGEFVAISTPRNVQLTFEVKDEGGKYTTRKACYKLVAGGEAICSAQQSYYVATMTIPPEAVEVGYQVELPAQSIGPDWTSDIHLSLFGSSKSLHFAKTTLVRPNEPYNAGELTAQFSTPYRYKQTDTGWIDGEFIALSGNRNVALTFEVAKQGTNTPSRKACYKLVAGGEAICGAGESYYTATTTIPVEAVEVGYQVQLPATANGPDWTADINLNLIGGGKQHFYGKVSLIRPNEPYTAGSLAASFSNPYNFQEENAGWTDGDFVALTGARNTSLSLSVDRSGSNYIYRKACYRLVAGGQSTCGAQNDYYPSTVTVPVDAVEVGYQINLPARYAGPAWTNDIYLSLSGGGKSLFSGKITLTRPNAAYQRGGVASQFTSPYSFAETDTGNKYGEFIALTGPRNVGLSYTMNFKSGSGHDYSKAPCYKLVSGGAPTCATLKTGSSNSITVPVDAVEIGYVVSLYGQTAGPDYTTTQTMVLQGGGQTILNQNVEILRPNEPYNSGSMVGQFSPSYEYPVTATSGSIDGEYVAISGTHNHNLTFTISLVSGSPLNRQACYRMVAGGTPTCGTMTYNSTAATVSVPKGAVEVGHRFYFAANGTPYSGVQKMKLTGTGTTLTDTNVTITRPGS